MFCPGARGTEAPFGVLINREGSPTLWPRKRGGLRIATLANEGRRLVHLPAANRTGAASVRPEGRRCISRSAVVDLLGGLRRLANQ
ncbi:hypothetical protein MHPYR_400058 [uncultured Mycobacterium sp.]|uniref:Uncharacterized protein n=1 Tax=uncultured Mycobacterium sp. TaxID=171292 RepID=A0A1Y5PEZ7_9MYCO|nr:hypothetical protein MHPYR_400058 [uncultured Mycobacterium sp.]